VSESGRFPGCGEIAVEIHLCVASEQTAEDQAIEALRLAVRGETGIEVDGLASMRKVREEGLNGVEREQPAGKQESKNVKTRSRFFRCAGRQSRSSAGRNCRAIPVGMKVWA
jgi:hypothetical protein